MTTTPHATHPMLTVDTVSIDVNARGRTTSILEQVSLRVEQGQIYGFLGINGAGKTTLMSAIVGLRTPHTGTIMLDNQPLSRTRAVLNSYGYTPDISQYPAYLTGLEFCVLMGQLHDISRHDARTIASGLLTQLGLADALHRRIGTYSKGMKQRTALAASLVHDPSLILWDEPMSGLDPIGRKCVKELIRRLRDDGKTIFFATHILADVQEIADRFAILHNKNIVYEGAVDDIDGSLETFFVERVMN